MVQHTQKTQKMHSVVPGITAIGEKQKMYNERKWTVAPWYFRKTATIALQPSAVKFREKPGMRQYPAGNMPFSNTDRKMKWYKEMAGGQELYCNCAWFIISSRVYSEDGPGRRSLRGWIPVSHGSRRPKWLSAAGLTHKKCQKTAILQFLQNRHSPTVQLKPKVLWHCRTG